MKTAMKRKQLTILALLLWLLVLLWLWWLPIERSARNLVIVSSIAGATSNRATTPRRGLSLSRWAKQAQFNV